MTHRSITIPGKRAKGVADGAGSRLGRHRSESAARVGALLGRALFVASLTLAAAHAQAHSQEGRSVFIGYYGVSGSREALDTHVPDVYLLGGSETDCDRLQPQYWHDWLAFDQRNELFGLVEAAPPPWFYLSESSRDSLEGRRPCALFRDLVPRGPFEEFASAFGQSP